MATGSLPAALSLPAAISSGCSRLMPPCATALLDLRCTLGALVAPRLRHRLALLLLLLNRPPCATRLAGALRPLAARALYACERVDLGTNGCVLEGGIGRDEGQQYCTNDAHFVRGRKMVRAWSNSHSLPMTPLSGLRVGGFQERENVLSLVRDGHDACARLDLVLASLCGSTNTSTITIQKTAGAGRQGFPMIGDSQSDRYKCILMYLDVYERDTSRYMHDTS
jgi:hypothetical protein